MLVGALDVEVGPHALAVALLDHISVGRAAIETDVEDVGDRLVIGEVVVVAEQGLVVGGAPGIGAALEDRKSVGEGTSGSDRVERGGRRISKKKNNKKHDKQL